MYLVVLNLCRDSHSPPPHPSSPQPASLEPQRLPSVEGDLNKNSAKSPGSAVLCRAEPCMRPLRCESREVGSSPKLCLSFYKKKTKVWGMDLQRWVRRSGVSRRRRRPGSQEFGRLRGDGLVAGTTCTIEITVLDRGRAKTKVLGMTGRDTRAELPSETVGGRGVLA